MEAILTSDVEPCGPGAKTPSFEIKAYGPAPGDFRIGLAPIPVDRWLEGSLDDPAPRKRVLLAADGPAVWGEVTGSRPGQAEALALVSNWLGVRASPLGDDPQLLAAADLVEDDLCLMERRDGAWTLTAASLCSASFFTAREAVGRALHQLHAPVPGFNARLLIRVARIFDHLAPDAVLERRNWSVVNSAALSLPSAAPIRARIADITLEAAPGVLHLRSERQTIRRLPRTGGVLFTIRIWREALGVVLADPARKEAFQNAWRTAMNDPVGSVRTYKGFALYDPLIAALLDQP